MDIMDDPPAIRFEGFADSTAQNPGGPTQVYCFDAAAVGEAQVTIPHTASPNPFRVPTFALTIRVTKDRIARPFGEKVTVSAHSRCCSVRCANKGDKGRNTRQVIFRR